MDAAGTTASRLREYPWRLSYSTSDGNRTDILHDFYIPALSRASRYDRFAGYFRSTSLAAASQGFSAFVERDGRMRLIVGCDLEPADVLAVLAGESQRLTDQLNSELDTAPDWPEDVRRGVELLAWMVKEGRLEVRVAFQVDPASGKPISAFHTDEGYAHQKFGLMWDESEDGLYFNGSLNESRKALVKNGENIEVHCTWASPIDRRRFQDKTEEFERCWNDETPSLRVMVLPDAVRDKLLKLVGETKTPVEVDDTSAVPPKVPGPSALEWLKFAVIKYAPQLRNGQYVGMETAPIEAWPHQHIVARRLVDAWPNSFLLCDEVGLGKTIESGLALRSLYLAGLVRRTLIAAPAHVATQWARELASKFLLPFARVLPRPGATHEYLWPREDVVTSTSIVEPPLVIASTGLLVRAERRKQVIESPEFDVALLDEGHYARRRNSREGTYGNPEYNNLYQLTRDVLRVHTRSLWIATATPMQLHSIEAADLMRLTRRGGIFTDEPGYAELYYHALGKIRQGTRLADGEAQLLRGVAQRLRTQDPQYWGYVKRTLLSTPYRLQVEDWLDRSEASLPVATGARETLLRVLFACAPLSRVMQRHSRALLEEYRKHGELTANLARRHVLAVPELHFNPEEQAVYDLFEPYCQNLGRRLTNNADDARVAAIGFLLSFLRLRFSSSLYAIQQTLKRRHERIQKAIAYFGDEDEGQEDLSFDTLDEGEEDDEAVRALLKNRTREDLEWENGELAVILDKLDCLTAPPAKLSELLRVLEGRRSHGRVQQTIVFTRFYDTLVDLERHLRSADPRMRIGVYAGPACRYVEGATGVVRGSNRDEVKRRFLDGDIDVLLCTDAAAEGLNLQTADLLVNYDLPWNPTKVEQRIGRIDRIGQTHNDIYVLNLCYVGSVEHEVYVRLIDRLRSIGAVVGSQQSVLLPITPEEFESLANKTTTFADLETEVRGRLSEMKAQAAAMELPAPEMYAVYKALAIQYRQTKLPVTLEGIWTVLATSDYLSSLGCAVTATKRGEALVLHNVPGVRDGTALTISRDLYERGSSELIGEVHFATYGDPAFSATLQAVLGHDQPSVAIIEAAVPSTQALVVGLVVKSAGSVSLVHSLEDVSALPNGMQVVDGSDCESQRHELTAIADELSRQVRLSTEVERQAIRAGKAQHSLTLAGSASFLEETVGDKSAQFSLAINQLRADYGDRAAVNLSQLPVALLSYQHIVVGPLSASATDPNYCRYQLQQPLLEVLLGTATREARAMKKRGTSVQVESVIRRLNEQTRRTLGEVG